MNMLSLITRRKRLAAGTLAAAGILSYEFNKTPSPSWQVWVLYRLPCRALSRVWGNVSAWHIHPIFRPLVYNSFALVTGANLSESALPLQDYKSLSDLFTRELSPGARPIDRDHELVSPVDGKIVHFGKCVQESPESFYIHAKGVCYSLEELVGSSRVWGSQCGTKETWFCTIYLSPKDYHRVHGATDWYINECSHIVGGLLPVNPILSSRLPDIFTTNERVVLKGRWPHGKFSLTSVGAFNVGSIRLLNALENSVDLHTNHAHDDIHSTRTAGVRRDTTFPAAVSVSPEDQICCFDLGSTVVLVFEAPHNDFEFTVEAGQHIRLGEGLGRINRTP